MINSTYNPMNISDLEKGKLNFNGQKIQGTCVAGGSVNVDLTLTDDHLMTGASLQLSGNNPGDSIQFQIVHPVAGVLNQFIDWYAKEFDKEMNYPAKIPAGLILRLVYNSTGASNVDIFINYSLHKVLI